MRKDGTGITTKEKDELEKLWIKKVNESLGSMGTMIHRPKTRITKQMMESAPNTDIYFTDGSILTKDPYPRENPFWLLTNDDQSKVILDYNFFSTTEVIYFEIRICNVRLTLQKKYNFFDKPRYIYNDTIIA